MFKNMEVERHVPSWKALEWLIEDYGLSLVEMEPYERMYPQISTNWRIDLLAAVMTTAYFCPSEKRHKWRPNTTIDSME